MSPDQNNPLLAKTSEELVERQCLLDSEITANEEENRFLQQELDSIYAEQDGRRQL